MTTIYPENTQKMRLFMDTFPEMRQTSLTKCIQAGCNCPEKKRLCQTPFCSYGEHQDHTIEDTISKLTPLYQGKTLLLPSHTITIAGDIAFQHVRRYEKVSNEIERITPEVTCQFLASSSVQ